MALNIKNHTVEKLLDDIVSLTGESKTEAVKKALEERHYRLKLNPTQTKSRERLFEFLEEEIWSQIPNDLLGKSMSKQEKESILGYGEDGV